MTFLRELVKIMMMGMLILMGGCVLLSVGMCTLFGMLLSEGDERSDQEMIAKFEKNRGCFETILGMMKEDSHIQMVDFERFEYDDTSSKTFEDGRIQEYRKLFRDCEVELGVTHYYGNDYKFRIYAFGLVTGGDVQGYLHTDSNIQGDSVSSVDGYTKTHVDLGGSSYAEYIHLGEGWYAFWDHDD